MHSFSKQTALRHANKKANRHMYWVKGKQRLPVRETKHCTSRKIFHNSCYKYIHRTKGNCRSRRCMVVILATRRLSQEDCPEFKASVATLGNQSQPGLYSKILSQKTKQKQKQHSSLGSIPCTANKQKVSK